MPLRPPRSTCSYTLFPYTTLFRSGGIAREVVSPIKRGAVEVFITVGQFGTGHAIIPSASKCRSCAHIMCHRHPVGKSNATLVLNGKDHLQIGRAHSELQ